jgi:metal-responsive CopG/Arc/MetJ family transcriptional regulator
MPYMKRMGKDQERSTDEEHMTERIIIPVTPSMAEEIKEYWHARRLNSKSEAVRMLIRSGLDAEAKKPKPK